MDLNYLLRRQQVERSRAEAAASEAARKAHEELARKYEQEIEARTGSAFRFLDGGEPAGGNAGGSGQD